jgi:ABC-type branched-subunit amino acid transport system substrate-binding protein
VQKNEAAVAAVATHRSYRPRGGHSSTVSTVFTMEEVMKQALRNTAAAFALAAATAAFGQQGPVQIIGLVELSGTGATAGTNFDNRVKLAVKEINAAGGILGRKIEYTSPRRRSTRARTS